MHPLLRVAIALEVIIAALHGFLVAEATADQYPLGATAAIELMSVPQGADALAVLTETANDAGTPIARVRYRSTSDGAVQSIAVLPSSNSKQIGAGASGRLFGFSLITTVAAFAPGDEVIGRWVSFGSAEANARLIDGLSNAGFDVESSENTFIGQLTRFTDDLPLLGIEIVGLFAVLVTALVSASRETRVRAARQLYGASGTRTVLLEAARYARYAIFVALIAVAAWVVIAVVGWRGRDSLSGPGLLVASMIGGAVLGCIVVSFLAVVVMSVSVPSITSALSGKRPLLLIQCGAAIAFVAVILGAFVSIDRVNASTDRLNAAISANAVWAQEPDARSIALAKTSEEVVQQNLAGWAQLVAAVNADGGTLLSFLQTPCPFDSGNVPCLFVNANYIDRVHVHLADGSLLAPARSDGIRVVAPEGTPFDRGYASAQVAKWAQFQHDLNCDETSCTDDGATAPAVTSAGTLAARQSLPVFSSAYQPDGGAVADPLLIVVPDDAYSADFSLAVASSGNLIFFSKADALSRLVDETGVRPLVFSIDRPADLAASFAIEARTEVVRNAVTLMAALTLAFAVLVVLTGAYVERQRKPLFLGFVHGSAFSRRHAGFLATLAAGIVCATFVSIAVGLASTYVAVGERLIVGLVAVVLVVPVLAANERRFHADFLKRP